MTTNDPSLQWLDGKLWELEHDWCSTAAMDTIICVPEGFVFDLASIPRLLWVIKGFAPFELSTAAPLVHDYLYKYKGVLPIDSLGPDSYRLFKRSQTDKLFRLIMKAEGVGTIRRTLAWLAVRLGGFFSWRSVT